MQSNDVNAAAVNGKEAAYFGVPWEDAYGYAQAIKVGDTIHVSGQLSHDEKGNLIAPASLDESGKPAEFSMMEQQMRATYANQAFGALRGNAGQRRRGDALCPRCRRRIRRRGQGAQGGLRHGTTSVRQQPDRCDETGLSRTAHRNHLQGYAVGSRSEAAVINPRCLELTKS